jgi:PAS domain S-box-containing protein
MILEEFSGFIANRGDSVRRRYVQEWLQSEQKNKGFKDVCLVDAAGRVLLAASEEGTAIDSADRRMIDAARRSGRVMLSDLERSSEIPDVHLDLIAPIISTVPGTASSVGPSSEIPGAVLFRIDPDVFLYPLIQSWPAPSPTAETLLVEREGEEVVFLNELRHRKKTALTLRLPITRGDLPAVMAVRGISGVVTGSDYRGVPVLAALRPIRGTSWFMVAKVDLREIHGPLRRVGAVIVGVCLLFILSAGLVLMIWWLRQSRRAIQKEGEAKLERLALNKLLVIEHAEAEAHEFAESLINTVREPLIALDQDLRVVRVNSSFYSVFKVRPEETVGQHIYDLGNKQWDIPKLRELLETILPQKTSFDDYEVEHDFASIGKRTMLLNARQIHRVLGKERIILLAIEDITERKRAEEAIGELTRELEAFSYSVSHDLRTPLRAIDGFSRIVLEEYASALDPEAQRLLGVIRDSTKRMGQLIDDLLAFSRLGRTEIHRSRIDVASMVRSVFEGLLPPGERDKTEFRVGSLPDALSDPALLLQVWINLLSNAIKFSGKAPRRVIEVGAMTDAGQNTYFVRDNGVGFDMQYNDKLFGVFQRLHTVEEFEGTGVGLAIVRRIIQRLGGRVWAEGHVGAGATFSFSLPQPKADDMEENHGNL